MSVFVCERQAVCVCVSERIGEGGNGREVVCVCECVREGGRGKEVACVCVCVYVCVNA